METSYQFTLVLHNYGGTSDELADALYEAGCSDALINFRNNAIYLDFDRVAPSLEKAVLSGLLDISNTNLSFKVVAVKPPKIKN